MRKHEAEGVRASAPHTPSGRTIAVTLPIPTHVENFSDLAPLFAVPDNQAARLPGDYLRACARFVEDRLTDALNALLLCPGSGPWSKELRPSPPFAVPCSTWSMRRAIVSLRPKKQPTQRRPNDAQAQSQSSDAC